MIKDLYLKELFSVLEKVEIRDTNGSQLEYSEGISTLIDLFTEHKVKKDTLYFIGNGGSSAIASHMTADYMKNGGMVTNSLYDNAVTTCMGNDYGYEHVFSRPLSFLLKKEDVLIVISSSGNSASIVNAARLALDRGAELVSLTGFKPDNIVRSLGGFNIYVPSHEYGIVECSHSIILQQVVDSIAKRDGISL